MVDIGEKHARNILLTRHKPELSPLLHFVNAKGEHQLVTMAWDNDMEKHAAMREARKIGRAMNAVAMMFIDEMWKATEEMPLTPWHARQKEYVRPAERPDRKEVVLAVATDGVDQVAKEMQIVRTRPGGPIMSLVNIPMDKTKLVLPVLAAVIDILPKKGSG